MWNLTFISEEDFTNHVKATIEKYGEKLESFDLKRFNKNIIDPIKLIFDKTVYQSSWEEIVSNEIFRQRDKSNNNDTPSVIKLKLGSFVHIRLIRGFIEGSVLRGIKIIIKQNAIHWIL